MSSEAVRAGAAKALLDVLRVREPNLTWEIAVDHGLERRVPADARTGEVVRLVPASDDADTILDGLAPVAAATDPHHAERAA